MRNQAIFKLFIIMTALAALLVASAVAAHAENYAVTARYLYDLKGYGTDAEFKEPAAVFVDPKFNEIFVADSFNHRIKIFNEHGMLLFQFGSERYMRVPKEVAVDSRGTIYVLHYSGRGRTISVFNYRGKYLRTMSFEGLDLDAPLKVDPNGLTVDRADRLYIVDDQASVKRILVFSPEGEFLKLLPIMTDLDKKKTAEGYCGKPHVGPDGKLYIPNSMLATVYVYSPEGEFLRTIGVRGSAPGRLSRPVAVSVDSQNRVFVLDKMRHTVVVYNFEGRFLSEFGGFGRVNGWFYDPNSIAIDPKNRIYISQIVDNRVQVLQLSGPNSTDAQDLLKNPEKKGGDSSVVSRGPKNAF